MYHDLQWIGNKSSMLQVKLQDRFIITLQSDIIFWNQKFGRIGHWFHLGVTSEEDFLISCSSGIIL